MDATPLKKEIGMSGKTIEYGIEVDIESQQEFSDLVSDPNRHTKAATEIDAALAEFHSAVKGILEKHGVRSDVRPVRKTSMRSLI